MIACRTIHIGTSTVGTNDKGRRVMASEPGSGKIWNSEPGADITPSTIATTRSSMPKAFQRCSTTLFRAGSRASQISGSATTPLMMSPQPAD